MTQRTCTDWDWGRVRALCLREAHRLLGPCFAADDAAQEAAIRAWRHRSQCRDPGSPEPWIARIARREALRTLAHRPDHAVGQDDDELADLRQELSGIEAALDLRRAVCEMDGRDRRILIGHYWQDLPNRELAMQLGLAEVTVRVRLHRIRQRLRDTVMEI